LLIACGDGETRFGRIEVNGCCSGQPVIGLLALNDFYHLHCPSAALIDQRLQLGSGSPGRIAGGLLVRS